MKHVFYSILIGSLMLTAGCKKDSTSPYTAEIENITDNVIVPTYKDLDDHAGLLLDAVNVLASTTNSTTLDAARAAWRAARTPWESSEGFLFGPVEDKDIDPNIDTWPLDASQLDSILAGSATLDQDYVNGLAETLKGFHTIEYLLWGTGSKTAGDFTAREKQYLIACTQCLKAATSTLYTSWTGSENYKAVFKSRIEKEALQELVDGVGGIAGEVGDSKILEPYAAESSTLEESSFSANSKQDFADNIRSIEHIYLGVYGTYGNGKGLTAIVAAKNAALDAQIKQQIDDAIDAINNIQGTFSEAIQSGNTSGRASVQNAMDKVNLLQATLKGDLKNLVDGL